MGRALTGIRPTGELTVANNAGAIAPVLNMQGVDGKPGTYDGPMSVFVADVHGLTDQEPDRVNPLRIETARAWLAAGIDPDRTILYLQSQIEEPTLALANILARHVSVAELLRVPTLKEKVRGGHTIKDGEEFSSEALASLTKATYSLFGYPVLMAADICVQGATDVPVGKDQAPHIELTRRLARRFNNQYAGGESVLVEPNLLETEAVNILALKGEGKMSKSNPSTAIFLKDDPVTVARKIRGAQTALPGEMTPALESHFTLAKSLCTTPEQQAEFDALRARHLQGEKVMPDFKDLWTLRTNEFLANFQDRYYDLADSKVKAVLLAGGEQAREQAEAVVKRTRRAMGFVAFL